jgi:chromosome partitioning protein
VYDTVIPRSVKLAESPSFGEPVIAHAPSSRGAVAYERLAEEIVAREEAETVRQAEAA